jgi:hypothetical protein
MTGRQDSHIIVSEPGCYTENRPPSQLKGFSRRRLFVQRMETGRLLSGNDDPQNDVGQQARQPARDHQQQKEQPEPYGVYAKESAQPTTNSGHNTILAAQFTVSHIVILHLNFSLYATHSILRSAWPHWRGSPVQQLVLHSR